MLLGIDGDILLWIQENLRSDVMTPIWKFITDLGKLGILWILISLVLMFIPKTRRIGMMSGLALVLSVLFTNCVIKNIVARPRPFDQIEGLICLVKKPRDYSFPSGHTSASFAAGVVFLKWMKKRYGVPLFGIALLIAFSRLYLGVHYPSDVLGGAIIGTLIAFLAMWIYSKTEGYTVDRFNKRKVDINIDNEDKDV